MTQATLDMSHLTREQAIAIVGVAAVEKVEAENCEPTNRVGFNGACQGDDECEWSAFIGCEDLSGEKCRLTAYYYTTNEEDELIGEDGSSITWVIHHFSVE